MIVNLERKYKATDMAEQFNVSVGTIYRHLRLMKIS
jgi:predicted DNA binding protein